jgi:NAD(P)-dependent dehydrogenase (short-subunit alcohol dehydrogenase family)
VQEIMKNISRIAAHIGRSDLHIEQKSPQTVVVTGASAGIGRAVARAFGSAGARVALIARGHAGLEAAARDVEKAGGTALVIAADVADYDAVDQAAATVEERFGPIDVWVNDAFATIFAPFDKITADEFRRATEVSYLGFVHGTMAALTRMKPRDRGAIVQIGSALGERSIPLQSAYCGAKHAINGFTESLRTELLHDHSNVHVTIVQMPGVNTPQFSWVRSRLQRHPQPVPPVYQPEISARAVLYAAKHPEHKQYWVGASTVLTVLGQRVIPAVLDRYLARTGISSQQTDQPVDRDGGNLFEPLDEEPGDDYGAHGVFDEHAHAHSSAWWLRSHARPLAAAALAGTVGVAAGRSVRDRLRTSSR